MATAMDKLRFLIVEDEAIVARDIHMQLVELGYDPVGKASRGEEAVVLAGELRPDLVLMDIQLKGKMDGIAAAEAIRTQFSLPIVFLTASAESDTKVAMLTEPFGCIRKPFLEADLRTAIEMALSKHKAEATRRAK